MPTDRFILGPAELVSVRFGIAPGTEALRAARRLLHEPEFPLQRALLARIARRVPPAALATLAPVIGPRGYSPDFLTQPPASTPEAVLAGIRGADPGLVAAELGRVRADRAASIPARWFRDPEAARDALADAWEQLWSLGIAPEWPALRRVLEADIATRSRQLAQSGLAATIAGLQPNLTWDGTAVLRAQSRWGVEVDCAGRGLLLVPTVMAWPRGAITTDEPWPPTIAYPAHHAERQAEPASDGPAVALLGRTRAAILAHLVVPARSVDVATALGISAATASHHLAILRAAGLITTSRVQTEAWHARTPVVDELGW